MVVAQSRFGRVRWGYRILVGTLLTIAAGVVFVLSFPSLLAAVIWFVLGFLFIGIMVLQWLQNRDPEP